MIQKGSFLNIIDNSGAREVACIRINASCKRRYAYLGENIIVSIKSLRTKRRHFSKVKKGEIYNALIVRLKTHKKDFFSNSFLCLSNSAILLSKKNKLIGTRIFGTIPKTFRYTKYMRILSLSAGAAL